MDNRLYLIGDLWETTTHKPMDYYVDDKWPKKKLQISPYNLYEGWADVIAHRLDANIYYVLDNKMTFGGTLDMAMDTVSQVRDTDYDSINYYFINLPLIKGKLDLISPSPEELKDLDRDLHTLYKGKGQEVSDSLTNINNAKQNDLMRLEDKIEEFSKFINENADYQNRFLISTYNTHQLRNFYSQWMRAYNKKSQLPDLKVQRKMEMLFDPKYTDKILTDIIFTDVKQNDFVVLYNTAINGKRQIRITEDAPLDQPIFRQGADFKGKGVQSKQLSKREHELVGRKIYNHLTEDTNLFIM